MGTCVSKPHARRPSPTANIEEPAAADEPSYIPHALPHDDDESLFIQQALAQIDAAHAAATAREERELAEVLQLSSLITSTPAIMPPAAASTITPSEPPPSYAESQCEATVMQVECMPTMSEHSGGSDGFEDTVDEWPDDATPPEQSQCEALFASLAPMIYDDEREEQRVMQLPIGSLERRRAEERIVVGLDTNTLNREPHWYMVEAGWLKRWREYVTNEDEEVAEAPGAIDNSPLLVGGLPKAGLNKIEHYRGVNEAVWRMFCEWYPGSGPELKRGSVNLYDTEEDGREGLVMCDICCDDKPAEDFKGLVAQKCTHLRTVCDSCVVRHIREQVTGKGNATTIKCPQAGCGVDMEHSDVRKHASARDFEAYDAVLIKQSLQAMTEFRWCSKPGCGNGQLVEGHDANPIMTCHHCDHRTCFVHRVEWHCGKTCAMYDEDMGDSEEAQLVHWMETHAKRCPQCSAGIEKIEGCDHMTCKRSAGGCGAEFCWRCGADYNGPRGIRAIGNTAHQPSCMWYR